MMPWIEESSEILAEKKQWLQASLEGTHYERILGSEFAVSSSTHSAVGWERFTKANVRSYLVYL